jgi:hypothetical protein
MSFRTWQVDNETPALTVTTYRSSYRMLCWFSPVPPSLQITTISYQTLSNSSLTSSDWLMNRKGSERKRSQPDRRTFCWSRSPQQEQPVARTRTGHLKPLGTHLNCVQVRRSLYENTPVMFVTKQSAIFSLTQHSFVSIQSVTITACTWAILGMSIQRHCKARYNNIIIIIIIIWGPSFLHSLFLYC